MLNGKHILIGITGGIAAYKIPELIRLLRKEGAEVRVTATAHALEFVTPLTLQTVSDNKVYTDMFSLHNEHTTEHISLPEWADLMIVAPCTANTLGKLANGIADDALSTAFIATKKPVLIVPAMNCNMYGHPATQHNLQTLRTWEHIHILDCAEGDLACGTQGKGRMQEVAAILNAADSILEEKTLLGKRILITAGPTQEQIDPVRFISNYSSGKMGYALARICQKKGAEVILISGPTEQKFDGQTIRTTSAEEMYKACVEEFQKADITILCAAVADFTPETKADQKIKREKEDFILRLHPTHDIAATLGQQKKNNQLLIGFALETQNEIKNAQSKIERKNLDYIVLNSLRDKGAGFGTDTNKITVLSKDGSIKTFPLKSKEEVARDIVTIFDD
ncbi:MAG: bifunctional phosphopantothenoylcysteine decarboxylase/phosphopantothenate--cysteine ligase CoaBC [Bacteroidales bacterium]|nr:bifunctional phosphopantothenoylcysteine decarboxylase/phosphopantothenate--cysteine ligase CoaBC [Bacteroidales bacterium]